MIHVVTLALIHDGVLMRLCKCLNDTVFHLNIYLFGNKFKLILTLNISLHREYKKVLKNICANNNTAFQTKIC